jgi:hypothetical protein
MLHYICLEKYQYLIKTFLENTPFDVRIQIIDFSPHADSCLFYKWLHLEES